ncbi:MAG: GFA family protein [Gammaproteobacteria bacterium]|nr:GFA family protein [Gammaproteobacteria bacterium]
MSDVRAKTTSITGRCLCGAVRYTVTGAPKWVAHCHCESCRRNTGSAVATFVGFHRDQVDFVQGERRLFASSPGVRRGFCADCGTPISYEADRFGDEIHLYLCTLDDPDAFPAESHVYHGERVAWFEIHDALPRYAATARADAPASWGPLHEPGEKSTT